MGVWFRETTAYPLTRLLKDLGLSCRKIFSPPTLEPGRMCSSTSCHPR